MESPSKLKPLQLCKLVLVSVCLLLGTVGLFFFIWLENFRAAWKCGTLVLACTALLHLNITVIKGKLLEKYSKIRMKRLRRISIFFSVTSFLLIITNFILGCMSKQGFQLEKDGYFVTCIPSFLSMVWFVVLAFESKSHLKELPHAKSYAIMSEEESVVV